MKCIDCGRTFLVTDCIVYTHHGCHCENQRKCFGRRKNMVQTKTLKITAEVDGKQVPLETVSTETFEAIKALEKPKEIPVARLATYAGSPRLLFRPMDNMQLKIGKVYSLDLRRGVIASNWKLENDEWAIENTYPGDVRLP